jgi:beta-lactamase class A
MVAGCATASYSVKHQLRSQESKVYMTSAMLEQVESQSQTRPMVAKPRKRVRKVPPGQRLLAYGALSGLLLFLQAGSIPIGGTLKTGEKTEANEVPLAPPIKMSSNLEELKNKLAQCAEIKGLHAGVFVSDQVTGRYVDFNGHEAFPAASMIKLPVFVGLLRAVDAGRVKPDDMLEIKPENVTGGSGWLQWRPLGSKISVRDTADLMITISDNTATNMLIDLLGGKAIMNDDFTRWGLTSTRINNYLGDFEGTNTTSPYDLVYLLARIDRGELLKPDSRKWMDSTMLRTRIRTLLPPGLGPGAKIAHKTGDIGCMVGDAGTVYLPTGGRYFVSMQVSRPMNDRRANLLIRSMSKMVYQCFSSNSVDCSQVAVVPLESLSGGAPAPRRHHRRHRHS